MKQLVDDYTVIIDEKVVWGEMDAFGHVNNTVYFRYFESVRIAYLEKIAAMNSFQEHQIGPILAATSCDYRVPLVFPDNLTIVASVDQIWEKRFNMKFAVYSESQDKIAAQGSGMVVYINYQTGRSCEIPASIIESIEQLENTIKKPG